MLKNFNLKIETSLIDRIKEEAKTRGISQKELIQKALEHFFVCSKAEENPSLKEIITLYKGKCAKCGKTINIGERALWGKTKEGSILICTSCQINSETDKDIVKRLVKRQRLERQIKALRNQLKTLLVKYEEYDFINNVQRALDLIAQEHKFFMEYQSQLCSLGIKGEIERIDEMINMLRKVMAFLKDFENYYEQKIRVKVRGRLKNAF
ncbi:hypothetical protein DRH29_04505 [candidate division Kazan bacterium]|uniref:Ribbon-helix-helix protein CopG domain-containing protein n=1 Tax=candidate division Kazan bacterium TaxID=2202143 RepID=A0A420ZBH9_UNCK3|nr:MAG: hypothetical protein DRH29_04505 [candidate division Kazan bacterium]